MSDKRTNSKTTKVWGLYNYGVLFGVTYTRRDAIKEAERIFGQPWEECKKSTEVYKVTVTEGWCHD